MGKLLIIKTGKTYESVKERYGDYEDIISHSIAISNKNIVVASVYDVGIPHLTDEISCVIITGSAAMVTDRHPWSVATEKWLLALIDQGIPIMGICYGHQLLAQALGGKVDYHPRGVEYGQTEICTTIHSIDDPLFGILPFRFPGYVAHAQSVTKLPEGALVLGHNDFEPHHIVRYREKVWGVQFHPEFSADIARIHVQKETELLERNVLDTQVLYRGITENHFGRLILRKFYDLGKGDYEG